MTLRKELENVIDRYKEEGPNTQNFVLAQYLEACLSVFDSAATNREQWYENTGQFIKPSGETE